MDNKLVEMVMERLVTHINVVDKQIREGEDLVLVLGSMVEMGKQLREKKTLDNAIENKRKTLTEIEDNIETRAKEEVEQISAIDIEITAEKKLLADIRTSCKTGIKNAEYHKNDVLATYALETENKVKKYNDDVKTALKRKQKAVSDCDEMENKRRIMKEDLMAKL